MWNIEDAFDLLMPFTTGFTAFTFAAYILWHVASFAKRYICDDEYDAHEHS
ncbi:hypothetical protein GWN75_31205, partial [candidate division KSB1 bacterium]|nr:hypothetical protein [Candidatus Saccharibacteria bacterium]NIR52941.1 hypothetical protein [candidate division KSB1 bacterium]NIV69146.1 hypothetical protein [Phycisphaerae bacterium]NIS28207.1 hypothetical protein [candidate division KSB1 bacterium]NIU28883.1 hypothetical protein [candidate division KSB1 bacterium]